MAQKDALNPNGKLRQALDALELDLGPMLAADLREADEYAAQREAEKKASERDSDA